MTKLLILACSATKRPDVEPLPAIDRYDGPAWRVLRRAGREHPSDLHVYALSARYGLIGATLPIPDYDQRMTPGRARELAPLVRGQLPALTGPYSSVFVNVGQVYRLALPDPLPWPATWAAGGIGERLHQLKEWLWEQ